MPTEDLLQSEEIDFNSTKLGSNVDFAKLTTQTAYYKKIMHNIIWANSIRIGLAQPFSGSFVPLSEAFFSGGGSTLRGFPLDSAGPQRPVQVCSTGSSTDCTYIQVPNGGNELLILNSEFRIPLPIKKNLGMAVFYDGGNVFPNVGFHDFTSLYSNNVGAGIAIRHPRRPNSLRHGTQSESSAWDFSNPIFHQYWTGFLRRIAVISQPHLPRTRQQYKATQIVDEGSAVDRGRHWLYLAVVGGWQLSALLHNARFHRYLLHKADQIASERLGAPSHIAEFLNSPIQSECGPIWNDDRCGSSPHSDSSVIPGATYRARFHVVSIWHRKWYFENIRADNPVVRIFTDARGISNLPTLKSTGGSIPTSFSWGCAMHRCITENSIVNNKKIPLDAELRDVNFSSSFDTGKAGIFGFTELS